MIPRTMSKDSAYPSVPAPTRSPSKSTGSDETDVPIAAVAAGPPRPAHGGMPGTGQGMGGAVSTSYTTTTSKVGVKKSERVRVKQKRDWKSSIEAYNNL